jgi:hypothetical protein
VVTTEAQADADQTGRVSSNGWQKNVDRENSASGAFSSLTAEDLKVELARRLSDFKLATMTRPNQDRAVLPIARARSPARTTENWLHVLEPIGFLMLGLTLDLMVVSEGGLDHPLY